MNRITHFAAAWMLCAATACIANEDTDDIESTAAAVASATNASFLRGDVNGDGSVDNSDPSYLMNHLFHGGPGPACYDAADANDDGAIDIGDAVYILVYLYQGGSAPPAPFPSAGLDLTTDDPYTCGDCVAQTCTELGKTCGQHSDGCGNTVDCDGQQNGEETDVDCGGRSHVCSERCGDGESCNNRNDCASDRCVSGMCQPVDGCTGGPCRGLPGISGSFCGPLPPYGKCWGSFDCPLFHSCNGADVDGCTMGSCTAF